MFIAFLRVCPARVRRSDESRFGARQKMSINGQFGVERINVAPPLGQRRAKVEQSGTWCRFEKTHLQRSGHGFDPVMEKAVGHCRIEQGADHPAVQNAGIPLPLRPWPDRGDDRARAVGPETQSERSAGAAGQAVRVAGWRLDMGRVSRIGNIPEFSNVATQCFVRKGKNRGSEEPPRKKRESDYFSVEFFSASICR